MSEAILGFLFIAVLYLTLRWFIKGLYSDARDMMQQARREFREVTGHDPPSSSRDNWFRWKNK